VLPICDRFIVAVENQRLNFKLIKSIKSDKIKIIETVGWKRSEKVEKVWHLKTDKAFAAISTEMDWCFKYKGDSVHEKSLPIVKGNAR
jgi:hypothetical protein